jgi:hypothetical protein
MVGLPDTGNIPRRLNALARTGMLLDTVRRGLRRTAPVDDHARR